VVTGFLGNRKADNYKSRGRTFIISETGVQYVNENPVSEFSSALLSGNCGSVSNEHVECFHQGIAAIEGKYKGKWSPSMLADYCWTLMRESSNSTFNWLVKKVRLH
jgi:hypothetical protein